jgi:hypothetical protein
MRDQFSKSADDSTPAPPSRIILNRKPNESKPCYQPEYYKPFSSP